jgi:hypothetical protein
MTLRRQNAISAREKNRGSANSSAILTGKPQIPSEKPGNGRPGSSQGAGRSRGVTAGRWAAPIYVGISLIGALVFFAVTTFSGTYPPVARYGGAVWVFILLMIVLMPVVITRVRKRSRL